MSQLAEVPGFVRTKNTHSLSLTKLLTKEPRKDIMPSIRQLDEISPKTPKPTFAQKSSLNPLTSPHLDLKKKNFYEIIGVPSLKDKLPSSPKLKVDVQSPRISLTDFMGKNKYSYLKKTGYIEYYEELKKNAEYQKIVDQKNTLSMPNIIHNDYIRENVIKNSNLPRGTEISTLFEKQKYGKQIQQERIDTIQKIIDQCDDLYKESKKSRNMEKELREDTIGKVVFKKRKAARRLTVQEKFLIKKQIENI